MSDPLVSLGVLLNECFTSGQNLSNWFGISLNDSSVWVGEDGLVYLGVKIFTGLDLVGSEAFFPVGELNLEFGGIFLLQLVHVVGNVVSKDSCSVDLGVEGGFNSFGVDGLTLFVLNFGNLCF